MKKVLSLVITICLVMLAIPATTVKAGASMLPIPKKIAPKVTAYEATKKKGTFFFDYNFNVDYKTRFFLEEYNKSGNKARLETFISLDNKKHWKKIKTKDATNFSTYDKVASCSSKELKNVSIVFIKVKVKIRKDMTYKNSYSNTIAYYVDQSKRKAPKIHSPKWSSDIDEENDYYAKSSFKVELDDNIRNEIKFAKKYRQYTQTIMIVEVKNTTNEEQAKVMEFEYTGQKVIELSNYGCRSYLDDSIYSIRVKITNEDRNWETPWSNFAYIDLIAQPIW